MSEAPRIDGDVIETVVAGRHPDPFAVLGPHREPNGVISVRAFLPDARSVTVVDSSSQHPLVTLAKVHPTGFFAANLPDVTEPGAYRLRVDWDGSPVELEDPYRFPPLLQELDLWLLGEGTHHRPFEALGAHPTECESVAGVRFAVWAPGAHRVSVVGDFNHWDGRRHPMRRRPGCGIWELFLPQAAIGERYQYELLSAAGELLALKADPYGFAAELRPAQASVVAALPPKQAPMPSERAEAQGFAAPIAVYEVHLGSWRRVAEENGRSLSYRELADTLVPYVVDMGFTHVEFLPITEHPFDGSWGYQPIGLYAPTRRFGPPEDFRALIERFHEAGIGVLMDWVPGHFPTDPHGLGNFDGSHLFEHADPRQGFHRDWNTLIFNYGRNEVRNYLIGNALYWLERYDIDGLRVDAVASMLYLDYSREDGDWVPNAYGGRENLEAISFLRRTNEIVGTERPGAIMVAEESTAWPMVTKPPANDGLGFHYKWNMGWMNDSLEYMSQDPIARRYHHNAITFSLTYAFDENFILPLSHDEVVHGKGSILQRMPGDDWQRFANLRAYYGFLFAHPGKKLLFMGNEFAQAREWNHDTQLDWHLTAQPYHAGVQTLVRELNRLYRTTAALHERDCERAGFEWFDYQDCDQSVLAFLRRGDTPQALVVVVCNFTPVVRHGYRLGVPSPGAYRECLNTDAAEYGGSGVRNTASMQTEAVSAHGHEQSLALTLPPLATVMLSRD